MQAWRAGHVLVANAFGTGVLESPALLAFLPPVCERLLGEPLAMPSVATWWCGEAAALDDAAPRLAGMRHQAGVPRRVDGARVRRGTSTRARGASGSQRLGAAPERYVLEDYLPLSHAPVWHDGGSSAAR